MKRWLFHLVAAASLALSIACFALQYRGVNVELMRRRGPGPNVVALHRGNLSLSWEPYSPYRPRWAGEINRHGFGFNVYSDGSWSVWGPLWVVGAWLAAIATLFAALAGWVRRRACAACGYDVRTTPNPCPECGA